MRKRSAVLLCVLSLFLFTQSSLAQPGYIPTAEELEAELQPIFENLAMQIGNDQVNAALYFQRANLYLRLYQRAGYQSKRGGAYAEKLFDDLNTAINLNPTAEMYVLRARMERLRVPGLPPEPEPALVVDRELNTYEAAMADLRRAIEISKDDYERSQNQLALAQLYFSRAVALTKPAEMAELRARGMKHSVWQDFDQGIELAKTANEYGSKSGYDWQVSSYREQVANSYASKGSAAIGVGALETAVQAYRDGEKYFDGGYSSICVYYSGWADVLTKKKQFAEAGEIITRALTASEASAWNCRYLLSRRAATYEAAGKIEEAIADYTLELEKDTYDGKNGQVSIKRAKLYLKVGQAEKAREDLTYALSQSFNNQCPKIYLLRAQAERRLGNIGPALADEETARALPYISSSCPE